MLAVVVMGMDDPQTEWERRKFGTNRGDLKHLAEWLRAHQVQTVVMESTAQYWKPVWIALETEFEVHLAQAQSNAAPRGRKTDFKDALRLVRRFLSAELRLSFVPDADQRTWRCLARSKLQKTRQRVRLQSQIEALLEEGQIKLSGAISDLLGASGRRILTALAQGEMAALELAALGSRCLRASPEELRDALSGELHARHRCILRLHLEELKLLDEHIEELNRELAEALHAHPEAIQRLCEMPGIRTDAAQQILAELGPRAAAFDSAAQLASWVGVCPGRQESAGLSRSDHSPKGNRSMRRVLNQTAWAAVRTKDCFFQQLFHRLIPQIGIQKALWAVAHRILIIIWKVLHDQVRYIERGPLALSPEAIQRRQRKLVRQMRKLGYDADPKPILQTPTS
jgi:transposase